MKFKFCFLGLLLAGVWCRAQGEESEVKPGHSMHGEAFNQGPRQAAYLIEGMPKINFPITTQSEEAQAFFNQGVGQLHGFLYFEAERSFRQVAKLDTNCAMAFWGMAMANVQNEKRARQFMEKAVKLTNDLGRRELLYVDSLAKFYLTDKPKEDKEKSQSTQRSGDERHRRYVKGLEQIIEEFPDDIEAKTLLVFKIWENGGRLKISSHAAADALGQQVLAKDSMHPVHHALIHLWNNEVDRRALPSAARCGQGSPGIAHMWHMPAHTYAALHRYADAAWQQEASARVDHAYMMRNRVLPDQIHNYAHNNDWLVRNLSYLGRVREAIDLARNMVELPRHPKYNTLSRSKTPESPTNAPGSTYPGGANESAGSANRRRENSASFGRSRLCDLYVKWELWDDLIALGRTTYLEPTDIPEEQAKRAKALGIAHFSKGNIEEGEEELAALREAIKAEKELRQSDMEEAETQARKEKKSDEEVKKAMIEALDQHANKVKAIENSLEELKLYQLVATGKSEDARKQLEDMKDFPKERRARCFLQLGDKEKAEKLGQEAVQGTTNQVQTLANYVHILAQCGKEAEAKEQFETLRALAAQADLSLPALARLTPIANSLGLSEDWRLPFKPATDVGERPDLEKLGPFRWQPVPAPEWVLRNAEDKKVALKDYRGRPVVIVFYLGHGCAHCIEQLNLFAPVTSQYREAGVSMVAVGTDSVDGLQKTLDQSKSEEGFPFQIVSNQKLDVFKAYRAYDDFESMPLHGTFLVDGNGMLRWQDVSFEPFTEPEFLLKEAKRLLNLSGGPLLTGKRPVLKSPRAASLE
ncbi:MAG: redoxin domain-containing protein [Verrucomicrobia subdivision 3 bacterium]|nr:redoxin domain-containing protein [Limisphaerales bacterium]